jgi:peptidoglycan biosynthesis protein MviN/MurJ (putative lipid II flippase)
MFFAIQNTKTPFFNSLLALGINVGLSWGLTWVFSFSNFFSRFFANLLSLRDIPNIGVIGLPLSISITGIIQFFFLYFLLKRKVKNLPIKEIWESAKKILVASVIMSGVIYLSMNVTSGCINVLTTQGILIQATIAVVAGVISYAILCFVLQIKEFNVFLSTIGIKFKKDGRKTN